MGIRGFGAAVRRYGKFTSLQGDTVVIDGPSLVHQILDGCMRQRPPTNGFICQPSYSTLGRLVISWLEELRGHNVTVRKIFFDGYLPPSKWQVRKERLLHQSQRMKDLLTSHPYGSSMLPEGAFEAMKGGLALTRNTGHSSHSSWAPKPPFLVPAVIEILRSCRTWGPLVEVVSGEADMFCAEDVRRHGGVLLTTDSDLLITELGRYGSVSFLSDIVAIGPEDISQGLVTCKFSLPAMNDALGLSNVGGLPRVAFEKQRPRTTFDQALERVRNSRDTSTYSSEFQTFMEQYSMKEYLPKDHPVQEILSTIDPRISEIIIQTLLLDGCGSIPDVGRSYYSRGPETLAIFLPVLIEDRNRRSAWTMSTAVRQLAYSIMQLFAVYKSPIVIEHRLLVESNSSVGRQIDIPGREEALEQCRSLIDVLKKLAERIPDVDMRWLAFAIYEDVMWSTSEERAPLSASVLHKAIRRSNNEEEYSWETVHFTAQVQASLYSLRILKQALDVALLLRPTIPPPFRDLRGCLDTLPSITDWPTVENVSRALTAAREADIVSVITGVTGVPVLEPEEVLMEATQPKKRKTQTGLLRSERDPKRPVSINPFSILSNIDLD
ncbi:hypothetical protein F5Y03DRAFT_194930 [Xylaria venustula]|nr:hypothetical protein F5Y03DRAFT_194930 [Xylaria venustula]